MLITNATVVTWDDDHRILTDYALYIANGVISAIGPTEVMIPHYRDVPRLDAKGQLALPGNICAHTHFYGAYARGMAVAGPPPADFPAILRQLWWPLDKALDADSIRASALVCALDAIKHGTTALIDHHASPNHIDGSLDIIADVIDRAGLRAVLCYEVTDRDGVERAEAGIAENVRFIETTRDHPRITGTFGLHASLTLSDETLRACADALPEGAGFHIHVAEHEADEDDSVSKYGKRVVNRLNDHGVLGPRTIAAHCVHIDDDELRLLIDSETWVSHQPRSNMNNGVGAMAFDKFMAEGVRLCLGNDGFSNNMWADWKAAYLLHKVAQRDPRSANGAHIAQVAVDNNARLLGSFFPDQRFGTLVEGAPADLILVDYKPFTPLDGGNLPWHVLFGFEASMVTTTVVAGKVLMRDRVVQTLDEDEITAWARSLAPGVWSRYQKFAAQA